MSRFRRIIAPLVLFALGAVVQAEDNSSVRDSLVQRDNDLLRPGTEMDLSASQPEMLPVQPFQLLTSEINLRTAGRRAAALRLAEDGRTFLHNRRPEKALVRLETSMALEASPYAYYYLALAHARLGHYRQTLNFLDVAETWLGLAGLGTGRQLGTLRQIRGLWARK